MVSIDGSYSEAFQTTEGVKQGAVLSPFLFNFFMDDLLNGVVDLKLGAALGPFNSSILAYCDDLLLISSVESHMNSMLDFCHNYACDWKLKFNAKKSVSYSIKKTNLSEFVLGDCIILVSNGFIYLGLPIGSKYYVEEYFCNKMSNCEKSFYSLRAVGCCTYGLNPRMIGFFYKQFCQSALKYGLENLYLGTSFINQLNIRQNLLFKNILGIKKFK